MSESDNDDFSEDSLSVDIPNELPAPLSFAPWHKPRKQYVRRKQWLHHSAALIDRLTDAHKVSSEEPFRYLTLPGPDMLDVQLLADLCIEKKIPLFYTGFCQTDESASARLRRNTQQFFVERGPAIWPASSVHSSKLEEVIQKNSEAYAVMSRGGSYHVINIDACKPLALADANTTGRLIDCVRAITEFQLNGDRQPWMLFLTTPVQTDNFSHESISSLKNEITKNATQNEAFSNELHQRMEDDEEIDNFLERALGANGIDFVRIVTLGISKWLMHIAEQAEFKVIKLKPYCYSMFRKEPFEPNMISTCFLFEPLDFDIFDATGLTGNRLPNPITTPEISNHVKALRKAFDIGNLDELMLNDKQEFDEMKKETKALLGKAGYPIDDPKYGYEAWIASEPIHSATLPETS